MEKQYYTTVIPKGTLLFRGVKSINDLISDFAGIRFPGNNYCLYPNFNVFFYPYPFISQTIKAYDYLCIFVLTHDIKIINLIEPSPFVRSDRGNNKGGIISCNDIEPECVDTGRIYDSCINFDVVKEKNVVGMIGIPVLDSKSLKKMIYSRNTIGLQYNKY